jgi:hypothetical protein
MGSHQQRGRADRQGNQHHHPEAVDRKRAEHEQDRTHDHRCSRPEAAQQTSHQTMRSKSRPSFAPRAGLIAATRAARPSSSALNASRLVRD